MRPKYETNTIEIGTSESQKVTSVTNGIACPIDSNTGTCSLASMSDIGVAYGSTDSKYMDTEHSIHGYSYTTSCGASCNSNYSKYATELCTDLKDKNSCKSNGFAGATDCCMGKYSPTDGDGTGGFDSFYCTSSNGDFFPWSDACVADPDGQKVIQDFCSEMSSDGKTPNLVTSANCQTWCLDKPDSCQVAMSTFCQANPNNNYCQCILRADNSTYTAFKDTGVLDTFNDGCWFEPCALSSTQMLIPSDICTGDGCCPSTVCQNVISVIDAGTVDISDIDQGDINCSGLSQGYTCDNGTCVTDDSGIYTSVDACNEACSNSSSSITWIWIIGIIIIFIFIGIILWISLR
ncbi:MAG: hypothetical protein JKX76_00995 [Colwellia sp.]|nr:hypothetical protein [Colwellia sp.]